MGAFSEVRGRITVGAMVLLMADPTLDTHTCVLFGGVVYAPRSCRFSLS